MNRTADFFAEPLPPREEIVPQVLLLRGFADGAQLWPEINRIACASPFRHMQTPGGGRMSVAITNCGELGWVSDRRGYRYSDIDPETGHRWPAMPEVFDELARRAAHEAGYASFASDACLVNRYAIGASMGSHQDRNERVSLVRCEAQRHAKACAVTRRRCAGVGRRGAAWLSWSRQVTWRRWR
jgi:alkylated DNA repair protein (DNA oxidative demethylase)